MKLRLCIGTALWSILLVLGQQAIQAQSAPTGKTTVHTIELALHPASEPVPALRYKFLPDEFEMKDGNAAAFYLNAIGFLEQSSARRRLEDMEREASKKAVEQNVDSVAPNSYLDLPPSKFPIEEVKQYLALTAFQPPLLAEAALRRNFDMNRDIKSHPNPIAYLLPEIQVMRDLARKQSIRFRLAVAENRIDDALAIAGQQFALSRHLGQDDFLISSLVGTAVHGIACGDLWYLVQLKDCPNLYWAFAQLPPSSERWQRGVAYEKHLLELQFPQLKQVNTEQKSIEYWQEFIDELAATMTRNGFNYWDSDEGAPTLSLPNSRSRIVSHIAASYPEARKYLLESQVLTSDKIDSYPTAQVFFLAMKTHLQRSTDEVFKYFLLPPHQAGQKSLLKQLAVDAPAFGKLSASLASVSAIQSARVREMQRLHMAQAVEAIRMYGAMHNRTLPENLDALPYPVELDPASGKPYQYVKQSDMATLTSTPTGNFQIVLKIRFAGAQ